MRCKCAKFFGMLKQEFVRVLIQPWFWIAALGGAVLQFVCMLGNGEVYQMVFRQGVRSVSVCYMMDLAYWESFLAYVPFCLCNCPDCGYISWGVFLSGGSRDAFYACGAFWAWPAVL